VLQRRAYDLLRDLGGQGPTISDALGAAALDGRRDVEIRAVRAGLDLLLFTMSENDAPRAHRRLVRAIRAKHLDPALLAISDARLTTLDPR
jgi:beta-glucosidase-like glycosyl hydrolase